MVQSRGRQAPEYYLLAVSGPDHDRRFTVEVRINGVILGKGYGKSKKAAEAEAARIALDRL